MMKIEKIEYEKKIYLNKNKWIYFLLSSPQYQIFKWQKYLRYEEYFSNKKSILGKIFFVLFKRKKNRLGTKLGFDVPINTCDIGLRIRHVGSVSINNKARLGKNCEIAGNVCIGSKNGIAPVIGDNCYIGWGAIIIGDIKIANGCVIGAGAVVVESCNKENSVLVGLPAKVIN